MFSALPGPNPLTPPVIVEAKAFVSMSSAKQLAANRANAQLSSGPATPEGKAKVSHNALKTGLTGRTVLLPTDDVAAYQAHLERTFQHFAPETDEEKRLTQSLADTPRNPRPWLILV